jgi:hydrogenase-4 membrane subunit HyfE
MIALLLSLKVPAMVAIPVGILLDVLFALLLIKLIS